MRLSCQSEFMALRCDPSDGNAYSKESFLEVCERHFVFDTFDRNSRQKLKFPLNFDRTGHIWQKPYVKKWSSLSILTELDTFDRKSSVKKMKFPLIFCGGVGGRSTKALTSGRAQSTWQPKSGTQPRLLQTRSNSEWEKVDNVSHLFIITQSSAPFNV